MGTVLSLACVVGCAMLGITIGRTLARKDSGQLYIAATLTFLIAVVVGIASFQSQPILLASVCTLAAAVLAAAWTQSGAEEEGRAKERDEFAARQRELSAPTQPYSGNSAQPRSPSRTSGGFKRPRQVDYLKLVSINYTVPQRGRKGRGKLRSVK